MVKNTWITGVILGVRNREGFAKDLVCAFPISAEEPLKVVEQGESCKHCFGAAIYRMSRRGRAELLGPQASGNAESVQLAPWL